MNIKKNIIMTPEKRAEELLIKYQYNGIFITDIRMDKEEAVECALICVDEMLKMDLKLFDIIELQEVKREINKL